MTYGGSTPAVTPSYSGFVNGDTARSLTTAPTCSTAATSSSSVGTYDSSCSGAVDPNYTFSYVDGSVQVNPAPLTIAASFGLDDLRRLDADDPASYSGFVNGDTAASLTDAADVLDDGDVVEPGGDLLELVLGRGRPQLHHQLRPRCGRGRERRAGHQRLVGIDDLRRLGADDHAVVLGVRER